ncbi:MAG TPA: trypsin-like peptidase domain-containing protein, partial [Gemmataceae bacterium]|nr:trypsin-like peptidase domain-containing protein [Gemmataceae bacterium]
GIVSIKVEKKGNWGRAEKSVGTGVIVDEHGYIVSNRHVITGASSISVCLEDGTELPAGIAAEEPQCDLAILHVQGGKRLHALALGPGSDLMVGETVIAVGHPFGYSHTVSTGIISALGRKISLPTGEELTNLIQTDASINPGNSGGPLLNINGELIGINVALREGAQGIAFAINIDTVKQVLSRQLSAVKMAGIEHGLICSESIVPEARQRQRVVVDAVSQQTPAAVSGLQRGDQIVRMAEQLITTRFDVERALWDHKPGEQIRLTLLRQGKELTVDLKLTPVHRP